MYSPQKVPVKNRSIFIILLYQRQDRTMLIYKYVTIKFLPFVPVLLYQRLDRPMVTYECVTIKFLPFVPRNRPALPLACTTISHIGKSLGFQVKQT